MSRFVLCLLITLELALVVWGGQVHMARIPDLPPPPTYTPVDNGSLIVIIGGNATTVRSDQEVHIDCGRLIENITNLGAVNPRVTWKKNDILLSNNSETNIVISQDGRFLIITSTALRRGGELGTSGLYTCTVCGGDSNIDCINGTSQQIVCGEPHLVIPVNKTVEPSQFLITLICGQDVTVPTLDGVLSIIINCEVFNGSEPFNITVYEDDTIVGNSFPHVTTNPKFATYTIVVATEDCGATRASSRVLQEGIPPSINTTMIEKPTTVPENKRVNVGNPVNISSGANLTIDCIATGTPPISIAWISGNNLLEIIQGNSTNSTVSSTITITVTNATDGDNITCRADNNIGYDEATTTINVDVCDISCKNGTRNQENCSCDCYKGYEGRECEIDINECDPNPCQNDGTCNDLIDDYYCNCTKDFDGKDCTIYIGKCPYNYMTVSVGFSRSSYRVSEGSREGFVKLTAVLDRPVGCKCYTSVSVITGEITATSDDYDPKPIKIEIPDGKTYAEFNIEITDDDYYEDSETFYVTIDPLSLPYGVTLGSNAYTEVTIMDDDSAEVKFKEVDCSVNESVGSVKHTLVLDRALSADVTIEVMTVNQNTQRDCDYDAGPYFVTIPAGEIEFSFNATIYDDDVYESNETFQLVIDRRGLPSRITQVHPYRSTVTILNDEQQIKVKFGQSNYFANEHEGPIKPELMLSKPSPCCLHVIVEAVNITATERVDYDAGITAMLNVTFPVGVTCAPFDIPLIDDTLFEDNETFNIIIMEESLPFGVILDDADKNTTATIIENDFYLHFEEAAYPVNEEDGSVEVAIVLDKVSLTDLTIQVMDVNGTATVGVDYNTGPYSVTINKGETKALLSVGIINDNVFENGDGDNGEVFNLAIVPSSLPDGIFLGDIDRTTVTILDDEYKFCFGQSSYLVEERGEITLPVSLNRPLRKDIMVNFIYVDLTATGNHTLTNQPIDYYTSHADPNVAFIPAGDTDYNLIIRIVDDRRLEDSELFRIITSPPDLPEGEMPCVTDVIIRDDDDFRVTFDEASYTVRKNEDITIGLSLIYPDEYDPSVMFPINVTIDEIDDTAIGGFHDEAEGADYVHQNYSYSFDDGDKKKTLIVRTIDDNVVEPDESYILFINSPTKGLSPAPPVSRVIVGENGTATITIVNDDVTYFRINTDKNEFTLDRALSEDILLNVTYTDNSSEEKTISAGGNRAALQEGVAKVEVFVPAIFRDNRMKSIEVPDNEIPITVTFVE